MIIVKLMGGHSNQLFQYAFGRSLATKHNTILKLDLSWFDSQVGIDTPRFYELGDYPIKATIATKKDLIKVVPLIYRKNKSLRGLRKILGSNYPIKRVAQNGVGVDKQALDSPDNVYLEGWWQSEEYFKNIREDLLKELEPIKPLNTKNKKYLAEIESSESISLHVRREDYITNPEAHAFHGLTPLEYYTAAVDKIKKLSKNKQLKIFVISQPGETKWCQQNIKSALPIVFVEGNQKGSDDMRLMKHCKHNILANSTFSWWGAWLNQNPNKIVVAPKIWFQDKKINAETKIIPKNWIRL